MYIESPQSSSGVLTEVGLLHGQGQGILLVLSGKTHHKFINISNSYSAAHLNFFDLKHLHLFFHLLKTLAPNDINIILFALFIYIV